MLDDFSYDSYRRLLGFLRKTNHNVTFADFPLRPSISQFFILRHDVDYSPEAAMRMAELEAELGIRATYFILFNTIYYNLLSDEYCGYPRRFIDLGHDVGLHFDLGVFSQLGSDRLRATLKAHVSMLEHLANAPVRSIAMHNPSVSGGDPFLEDTEFVNAYSKEYTERCAYFSDSCGAWRKETRNVFKTGDLPPRVHILIHPIFWHDRPLDRWSSLDGVVSETMERLMERVKAQKAMWAQHPAVVNEKKT